MVYERVRVGPRSRASPYKIFLSTPSSHTGPREHEGRQDEVGTFFLGKTMWQICAKLHHDDKMSVSSASCCHVKENR